jgi:hypothetical protein
MYALIQNEWDTINRSTDNNQTTLCEAVSERFRTESIDK